jgi:signal transduction histidine kinase
METYGLALLTGSIMAALISAGLAVYANRQDDTAGAVSFSRLQVAVVGWAIAVIAIYVTPDSGEWVRRFYDLRLVCATFAGVLTMEFIAEYTGSQRLASKWFRGPLWVSGAVYLGLWFLNPAELAYTALSVGTYRDLTVVIPAFGLGSIAYFLVFYLLLIIGIIALVRKALQRSNPYRRQAQLIAIGFIIVTIGTVGTLATVPGREGVDFSILLQTIGSGFVALSIYYFDFLSVVSPAKEAVIDELNDPVLVLDAEDSITYANAAAEAYAVTTSDMGESIEAVLDGLPAAIETGEPYRRDDSGEVQSDGGDQQVFIPTESELQTPRGDVYGRAILLRDVTPQKRRERLLEQFAKSLTHDLRNPLTVAHSRVELARQRDETAHLNDAATALERMDQLIDQLLDATNNDPELHLEPVQLSTVAEAAWQNVSTDDARLKHAGTDRSLFASIGHLQQILENLLRNAIEHNEGPITITVERTEAGFTVADTGCGIDPSDREWVFDRGSSAADGTGLGLDIVSQLAALHDWEVDVGESADGGAAFHFST